MKIFTFMFTILFSSFAYANVFNYSCLNDKNFQQIYEIDTENYSVFHKTSYDYDTNKKYEVYENEEVFYFTKNLIIFVSIDELNGDVFYSTISLKNNILLRSSQWINGDRLSTGDEYERHFYQQIYKCFKT